MIFVEPTASPGNTPITVEQVHTHRKLDAVALRQTLHYVAEEEQITLHALSVVLADHELVLRLNRQHLNHNYHTDVLAFPLSDDRDALEGEIYIDLDTAAERHSEFSVSFQDEVTRYAIHGLLHLAGYGDKTPADRDQMKQLEEQYLQATSELRK